MPVPRLSNLSLAALAAAAALAAVAAAPAAGAATPAARWIVFSAAPAAQQVQSQQLFRIQSSGEGLTQVTTGALAAVDPAFSPDGKRIAFARIGVGIQTVNLDGSGLHRVTTNGRDGYPVWSPDGKRIAFTRPAGAKWRLYTVAASGGKPHLLAKAPPAGRPSWTTTGLLIPSGGDLLRVADTTGRVLKYYGANIDAIWGLNSVALSPDLSLLTYIGARAPEPGDKECGEGPCQRFGLYLEHMKNKRPRLIVKDAGAASFSPDGKQLAYVAGGKLVLRSVAAGTSHALSTGTAYPTVTAPPAWQPR